MRTLVLPITQVFHTVANQGPSKTSSLMEIIALIPYIKYMYDLVNDECILNGYEFFLLQNKI